MSGTWSYRCGKVKDSKCFKIIPQWLLGYLGPIHSSLQCQGKDSGVLGGRQAGTLNRYSGALSLKSFLGGS